MKPRAPISLNALRTFEAVARHRNMTAAADELRVTPGAISRQISELQAALSFDLFHGARSRHNLTPSGQTLAATLTNALDQIDATLVDLSQDQSRILDVACLSTFAIKWLIPRMYRFRDAHPGVDLRLSTNPAHAVTHRMDISILAVPSPDMLPTDTPLFTEQLGPVISPALAQHTRFRAVTDLAKFDRMTSRTRTNAWDIWLTGKPPVTPNATTTFEHLSQALEATANGLGICIAPHHLITSDLQSGRLLAPFGFTSSGYTYCARVHSRQTHKIRTFLTWLDVECEKARAPIPRHPGFNG